MTGPMAGDSTDAEVAALVQRVREAASAIIRGDARGYFTQAALTKRGGAVSAAPEIDDAGPT